MTVVAPVKPASIFSSRRDSVNEVKGDNALLQSAQDSEASNLLQEFKAIMLASRPFCSTKLTRNC